MVFSILQNGTYTEEQYAKHGNVEHLCLKIAGLGSCSKVYIAAIGDYFVVLPVLCVPYCGQVAVLTPNIMPTF